MAILIGAFVGSTIGLVAGFLGGFVDSLLMRLVDILMAFPTLLLAIAVAAIVQGGGIGGLLIAIGVANIHQFARLVRGEATRLKHQDYIGAAQALGANNTRIMVRHLIPNLVSALVVMISLRVSVAILTESTLSFLGLGVSPPTAAWGVMISEGRRFLLVAPWVSLAPGVALTLTVLALNLFGDGLRDVLDPRLQNT
jgi:peptide/nickel transport system permease protein